MNKLHLRALNNLSKLNLKIYFPLFSVKIRVKTSVHLSQFDTTSTFQNHPAPFTKGSSCHNWKVNVCCVRRAVTSGSMSQCVRLGLHGHVFREHIGDVVPGVPVQTLFQPFLVKVMTWSKTDKVRFYFNTSTGSVMTYTEWDSPINPILRPRTKIPFSAPISTNSSASSLEPVHVR